MAQKFTETEWETILAATKRSGKQYGLPARRQKSVVLGTFNIRKLGKIANKSAGAWEFLKLICQRYDLLAIQEVQDNLDGMRHLKELVGNRYEMVVSDTTGNYPGEGTSPERLVFLYYRSRVKRGEVASDITYDRSKVVSTLYTHRKRFQAAFQEYNLNLQEWEIETAERKAEGKRAKQKPAVRLPEFVTFIRQPHCVAFEVSNKHTLAPYRFLAVNAHLLYGRYKEQRMLEFLAIISWLIDRAKKSKNLYYPNILFMGDCNLDFQDPEKQRPIIEAFLKTRNQVEGLEASKAAAELNFPFLDVHPNQEEVFRTAARLKDTYDQIALLFRDSRLPDYRQNETAGQEPDAYDYGVFNFVELFANTLHGVSFNSMSKKDKQDFVRRFEHDLTDHLPVWIRLPMP